VNTDLEGRIDVRLTCRDGRVAGVEIRSTRPQLARRLMAGRTPEEVANLAGRIFSLCGQAQRAAARAACDAALERTHETSDKMQVVTELAREHAWRLLLDWPQETGHAPDMASLVALRQAPPQGFADVLAGLLRTHLLGEAAETWLARDLDGLDAWRRQGATLPARLFASLGDSADKGISPDGLLPALPDWNADMAAALCRRVLMDAAFCARPDWQGAPAETGAVARAAQQPMLAAWIKRRGRGAGARQLARLLELAALPQRLRQSPPMTMQAWSIGKETGIAGVETSRGLLFHMVQLDKGRVADYRILAPTEWNFHPDGPLVQALSGLSAGQGLDALARVVCRSLDPCVAFGMEIVDA
jgi:hypothetical protein